VLLPSAVIEHERGQISEKKAGVPVLHHEERKLVPDG
jgi:hypothetical protein